MATKKKTTSFYLFTPGEFVGYTTVEATAHIFDIYEKGIIYAVRENATINFILRSIPKERLAKISEGKKFIPYKASKYKFIKRKFLEIESGGSRIKINVMDDITEDFQALRPEHFNAYMQDVLTEEKTIYDMLGLTWKLNFFKWHSISARSGLLLEAEAFASYYPKANGLAAYYGGRIEEAWQGHYKGPLYYYDINSAYPAAMVEIYSFTGKLKATKEYEPENYGIYKISFDLTKLNLAYNCFPLRRNGETYYCAKGKTWVTGFELAAYIERYGIVGFTILEGYTMAHSLEKNKFQRDLANLYAYRKAQPSFYVKKLLAGLYGKTIQRKGRSASYNSFYAAMVTGYTRAALIKALGQAAIYCFTDSILATEKLALPISQKLGEWKLTEYSEGWFIRPGINTMRRSDGKLEIRAQGSQLALDTRELLATGLETGNFYYKNTTPNGKTITIKNSLNLRKRVDVNFRKRKAELTYYPPAKNWRFWKEGEGLDKFPEK